MSSETRKPLWSDSEESDNEESKQKGKRIKHQQSSNESIDTDSAKEDGTKETNVSHFDSKWDHFPTSDEFKSIYGEAVWEQMVDSYDELSKSIKDIEKEFERSNEDKHGKRLTCWDTIETKADDSQPARRGPGRPPGSGGRPRSNTDEPPREKRKYTSRSEKLAALNENNENSNYKPRIQRADARNKGIRSLQCLHCEKRFETKTQARPHLEVHSGIKPYKCSQCDYMSYSKHNVTDAHFSKRHGKKGTNDDVITNVEDKDRLKALVLRESEQMLDRQDKLERGEVLEEKKDETEEEEEEGESYTSPYFQSKFNDIANDNQGDGEDTTKENDNQSEVDKDINQNNLEKISSITNSSEKTNSITDTNNNMTV